MLTQNKLDLNLIGNMVVDEVYYINGWPSEGTSNVYDKHREAIGGIGNILSALDLEGLNILAQYVVGEEDLNSIKIQSFINDKKIPVNVSISKNPTSKAVILSDLLKTERTSFVNWGCGYDKIDICDIRSRWSHISYMDIISLPNIDKIRGQSDILSADLCLSNPSNETREKVLDNLKFLDYLFISYSELHGYSSIEDLLNCGVKQIVLHKDKFSVLKGLMNCIITNNAGHDNHIDVLGAGDVYCAKVIENMLKETAIIDSIKAAHNQTSEYLLNRKKNEKI
jgi:sugar/nucleoside kinase (ribokinase family)